MPVGRGLKREVRRFGALCQRGHLDSLRAGLAPAPPGPDSRYAYTCSSTTSSVLASLYETPLVVSTRKRTWSASANSSGSTSRSLRVAPTASVVHVCPSSVLA